MQEERKQSATAASNLKSSELQEILSNWNVMSATFDLEQLKPNDLTKVNDFLLKNFFTREPLGLRLGIRPEADVSEWLSQVTQPLLDQQVLLFSKAFLYITRNEKISVE